MTLRISLAVACAMTCINVLAQGLNGATSAVAANASLELRQSSEIISVTPQLSAPASDTSNHPRVVDAALLPRPTESAASTATVPTEANTNLPDANDHSQAVGGSRLAAPSENVNPTVAPVPSEANAELPVIELSDAVQAPEAIDLTREVDDVFQRMRQGFSMPDINSDLVLYHQQWYLNRPDYLRRMVERSSLYLHYIVEELDRRDMPMELALLPMVESAYNPMAYSRAKASGLWQFIPATGKRYNLDQDWWKDERRDIVASTSAALDYLQSIYEMHGDWHLALASYNWGEGAVGRAINKNLAQGLPADYLSLNMPRETKNYVPKLQALKNIFSDPGLLTELNIPRIPNRPYFGTITQAANIDVKLAARFAEMPVQEFVALNPSHNRPVIKSDTPMVIPADKFDTFVSNLEAHEESQKPLSSWQSYTMRPGDKLESIAPRFGMSVANLKAVNGIAGRIKVKPGFTLLVAGKNGGEPLSMAALPEQPRLPNADPAPAAKANSAGRSHIVRKGDTPVSIAKHYGITIVELKRINHLQGDKLKPGMRLALNAPGKPSVTNKANSGRTETKPTQLARQDKKKLKVARYKVRIGDTLASIARQFRVATEDLSRWNHVSPKTLKPGKTLTIQLAQNP